MEPSKHYTIWKRFQKEGRWKEIEPIRDELMRKARKEMKLPKDEAREWAYSELESRFPPIEVGDAEPAAEPVPTTSETPSHGDGIRFSPIPDSWGDLPSNSKLSEEIQWVQSNRLRIVEETPAGTFVNLDNSLTPAPSHAALGWLETSVRAYSKYCEIAAKSMSTVDAETDQIRRERSSIEEIRDLLSSLRVD